MSYSATEDQVQYSTVQNPYELRTKKKIRGLLFPNATPPPRNAASCLYMFEPPLLIGVNINKQEYPRAAR